MKIEILADADAVARKAAALIAAAPPPDNPAIDYPGYERLVTDVRPYRAERRLASLPPHGRSVRPLLRPVVNRLSDLLFVLARAGNGDGGEKTWRPGASRA